MIFNVLLNSFLIIILSNWSLDVFQNKFEIKRMKNLIKVVIAISTCLTLFIFILRHFIVNNLYASLLNDQREKIAIILVLNMVGFIFNSATQVITRATMAFKKSTILVRISTIRLSLNIILDLVLVIKL